MTENKHILVMDRGSVKGIKFTQPYSPHSWTEFDSRNSKSFFRMPPKYLHEFARRGCYILVEKHCADGMVEGMLFRPTILAASIRLALHGRFDG